MTQSDPVARVLGYVLGPPIRFVGRRVERRVKRRLRALPVPAGPDLPEPPWWFAPVAVGVGVIGAVLTQLGGGADDPHPAGSRREHAEPEPEATAERDPDPTDGDEDAEAVAEALETLNVEHPPVPEKGEVRAQYRSLAVETHPDQGGDADRFIEVREAWETVAQREELSGDGQDVEVTDER